MSEERFFTPADRLIFIQYGATMVLVQQFEWSLKRLSSLYTELPENPTFEEAWKAIEKNLKLPAGPLINQLANRGRIPKELLEELWRAKEDRNYLAHEYIYGYVLRKSWDAANPRHAFADLQEKARYFQELYDE